MLGYERVLGDARSGDCTLFQRVDYVEEAGAQRRPGVKSGCTPVCKCEPGTWGRRRWAKASLRRAAGKTRHSGRSPPAVYPDSVERLLFSQAVAEPQELVGGVREALASFGGGAPLADDSQRPRDA